MKRHLRLQEKCLSRVVLTDVIKQSRPYLPRIVALRNRLGCRNASELFRVAVGFTLEESQCHVMPYGWHTVTHHFYRH